MIYERKTAKRQKDAGRGGRGEGYRVSFLANEAPSPITETDMNKEKVGDFGRF